MNTKRVLTESLVVCGVLALIFRVFARRDSAEPATNSASYEAIDAYVEEQMHRLKMPSVSLAIVEGDKNVKKISPFLIYINTLAGICWAMQAPTSPTKTSSIGLCV